MTRGKLYQVADCFYSLQGEGGRAGAPSVFLRFAGCNLHCTKATAGFDCDTDHQANLLLPLGGVVQVVKVADLGDCGWVVLTGGEPALQLDTELVEALHGAGYRLAVESNGTLSLPDGIDWVTVSPKRGSGPLAARNATEVKVVMQAGDPLPECDIEADYYYLSPAHDGDQIDQAALDHCVRLCLENPRWKLSTQQHKAWRIK